MDNRLAIKLAIIDPVGNKAGMDYYDLSLLDSISKLSIKTYLFTNYEKKNKEINIYHYFDTRAKNKRIYIFNLFKGFVKAIKKCKEERIHFVIYHIFSTSFLNLLPILLVRSFNLKLIAIAHDISGFADNDVNFFKKLIYDRLTNKIIVHNSYSYKEISKVLHKKSLKKVSVIKHGGYSSLIDQNMNKEKALKELNLNNSNKYILFFGQIKRVKGLDILLKAMPGIHNNIKLIIAGQLWRDDFKKYQEIIDLNHIENRIIKIIRFISDKERELLFKASDALIIPYRTIFQSGVLLMGMGYGLPIVASDLEPNKEIIKHAFNGILFKSEDESSLAEEINVLLNNTDLISYIGKNAQKTIEEEFSWDTIANEYVEKILVSCKKGEV